MGPNVAAPHIVGGSQATPHQFPWQVGIFMDDSYFCGGSIICKFDSIILSYFRITFSLHENEHNIKIRKH